MPISRSTPPERNYEFTFDGLDRKRYQAENRAIHTQLRAARGEREAKEMGKAPELTIHHMILKAAVPDEAYKQWSQAVKDPSKRADVKAFYIQGMVKDGQGEPFNAWVKPNFALGKMDFFKWNPDRAKRQGAEVKPSTRAACRWHSTPRARRPRRLRR